MTLVLTAMIALATAGTSPAVGWLLGTLAVAGWVVAGGSAAGLFVLIGIVAAVHRLPYALAAVAAVAVGWVSAGFPQHWSPWPTFESVLAVGAGLGGVVGWGIGRLPSARLRFGATGLLAVLALAVRLFVPLPAPSPVASLVASLAAAGCDWLAPAAIVVADDAQARVVERVGWLPRREGEPLPVDAARCLASLTGDLAVDRPASVLPSPAGTRALLIGAPPRRTGPIVVTPEPTVNGFAPGFFPTAPTPVVPSVPTPPTATPESYPSPIP